MDTNESCSHADGRLCGHLKKKKEKKKSENEKDKDKRERKGTEQLLYPAGH